ncbi:hypothetical protein AQ1_01277 [alpha proteobacterium Q-1]|nr:hypothetical protein [Iodidimonas nitroreducens]GAK33387.1 hypothetical protein AQ1_01277 [alpha proteobacterium Q-1]
MEKPTKRQALSILSHRAAFLIWLAGSLIGWLAVMLILVFIL